MNRLLREMPRRRAAMPDVAVVGGGMVGAATALALARAGRVQPSASTPCRAASMRALPNSPARLTWICRIGVARPAAWRHTPMASRPLTVARASARLRSS
jgi:glycine/D-amino acid oxidase-like deaminating enzyme